jgi:hypothetical protein
MSGQFRLVHVSTGYFRLCPVKPGKDIMAKLLQVRSCYATLGLVSTG